MQIAENTKKVFYTIQEVSEMLQVNPSLIRFWEKELGFPKPHRGSGKRRLYSQKNIDELKVIYCMIKEQGMTLEGVRKKWKVSKSDTVDCGVVIERLKNIRQQLLTIRQCMDDINND